MEITFLGVRGSTPCHGPETARYGGNTSCVLVRAPGEDPLVFDLGTGLRYLQRHVAPDGPFRGTALLSHMHWDHIQGLPFFAPLLDGDTSLTIYTPAPEPGADVTEAMNTAIGPPMFPIRLEQFPADVEIVDVGDDSFDVGGYRVTSRLVPHTGRTVGFRVEHGGRSVAYVSDHQQPTDGSFGIAEGVLELAEGVDLLIHDAQFTPEEFRERSNWGHCTIQYAVHVATAARARRLAMFHHDPLRDDDALDALCRRVEDCGIEIMVACEGQTVQLGPIGRN